MRYLCQLPEGDAPIEVDVRASPEGQRVLVGGKEHRVDVAPVGPDGLSLLIDGRSFDCAFARERGGLRVTVAGRELLVDVADERAFRLRQGAAHVHAEGRQTVRAPMPGKVVRVLVRSGEEVQAGQGLVVVEAMKMENELKSPKAGKVVELWAKEGSAVERDAPLVAVE